jgi:murein DD-endopeptidase MepM/ murein hydrolase activator NlpD
MAYTPPPIIDAKTESAAGIVDVGESLPQSQRQDTLRVQLPIDGPVTQGFGCSPFYTGIPGPGCSADAFWFHDGVDIAANIGTPVQAGIAGTVVFAGPDGDGPLCNRGYRGYGLAVIVDSGDGWQALYAHLSRIDAEVGQAVKPEMPVGLSGDTGCVSGAHLHFGLRRDGELVDPMEFVQ